MSEDTPYDARSRSVEVVRYRHADVASLRDKVAAEEPLEIRLEDTPLAVVMRTPGDDEDLIRGFLITEGIVLDPSEVASVREVDESRFSATLQDGIEVDPMQFQRSMFLSSSCGVCGKRTIELVHLVTKPTPEFAIPQRVLQTLPERLRQHQPTFDTTGGLHAAGLFSLDGSMLAVREDIGRHNAVDKVIGFLSGSSWPLPPCALVVSGRQSFEVIQKAAVAGVAAVVGVSAPSSLAVDLAKSLSMLLVGFARDGAFNVYSGAERIS